MKILLDATNMHGRVGGHETYLVNLLEAWHVAGPDDELVIVTTHDAPSLFKEVAEARGQLGVHRREGIRVTIPSSAVQAATGHIRTCAGCLPRDYTRHTNAADTSSKCRGRP